MSLEDPEEEYASLLRVVWYELRVSLVVYSQYSLGAVSVGHILYVDQYGTWNIVQLVSTSFNLSCVAVLISPGSLVIQEYDMR